MRSPDRGGPHPHGHPLVRSLLRPPIRDVRFWVVQAGILLWAFVHDVVLVVLDAEEVAGIPSPTTSALLLVPVMYAALNFGVRGGIGTAVWATVLVVPHWFMSGGLSDPHMSIEIGYLLALMAVAVVVGQRVEREQRARQRAEVALEVAKDAEARYSVLFEDQPAPVLLLGRDGGLLEANTAATRLLDPPSRTDVTELLGLGLGELLPGPGSPLTVGRSGHEVVMVPTAHEFTATDGTRMVQVVLSDITQQHRREEEQRVFARRMLRVQEEERQRLARELHDDPLQHLTYLTRALNDLSHPDRRAGILEERLVHAAEVADDAATSLRKIIRGLRPPVLDDLGLASALRQLTHETGARTQTVLEFDIVGSAERPPPDLELAAYRIAQEALNNVVRHAQARHATVTLAFTGPGLCLTVSDDGIGMGPDVPDAGAGHRLGLIGMRERVTMAGGTLEISSVRPHGTCVRAEMPLTSSGPS